jgi:predicted metalloprotease with PDZ domain
VPPNARILSATYDYVVATGGAFGSTASANAKIAVINWYTVGLYPMGENPAAVTVTATLKAPPGWKHGGSLDIVGVDGNTIRYAPTSLEMLNDHPVLLGEHFRSITLWPAESAVGEHVIDVVADSEWALQFPQARIEAYKRIVLEERAVAGNVGHYRKYHWLLTLSDNLGAFGVEHHECADDRVAENTFVDDDAAKRSSLLLPHEFFHSWNGKARRPAGLVNGGYEHEGSLIWLEADVTIRTLTNNRKTLDDFSALFLGQNDNANVWVKPYDVDEVYRTLNTVAAYDWQAFFEQRLRSKSAAIPLGGIERAGFALTFNDTPNTFTDPWALDGGLNAYGSLGVHVTSDGTVTDAWQDRPAYAAGISNGMKLVAVNGRRFSIDELRRALAGSKDATTPMEFIVDNGGYFKIVSVDYHGGLRYPHLERVASANDLLTSIAARRTR